MPPRKKPVQETSYRLSGRVVGKPAQAGLHGLRVEVWDSLLRGEDILGAAVTDTKGRFGLEFDKDHLARLGLAGPPRVFFKVFDRHRLVDSGEHGKPKPLKLGDNRANLRVDWQTALAPGELFVLTVTRPTRALEKPGGKPVAELKPGDEAVALTVLEDGYQVRLADGETAWIALEDLDDVRQRLDDYLDDAGAAPAFPADARALLAGFDAELEAEAGLACLLASVDLLDDIAGHALAAKRYDLDAMARFDAMLSLLIDRFQPPPRPENFTLTALRHEVDGIVGDLGVPEFGRRLRLPCLLDLGVLHRIGSAIFRSAWRRVPHDPAAINDGLWAGLFALGRLVSEADLAGAMVHQLRAGNAAFARNIAQSFACGAAAGFGFPQSFVPAAGEGPGGFAGWEPGRFPGLPRFPRFDCRVEQWGRTERAVRCCGQTYRIDEMTGGACPGEVLTITGAGFSHLLPNADGSYPEGLDPRIWPFPHAPSRPPRGVPRHLSGPPGPFENLVYFPTADGGHVAATDYPEWHHDRVEVVIPEGAVSGQVEMRVICDETFHGRPTDFNRCGLETRLPAHDPANARLELNTGTLPVSVGGRGPDADGVIDVSAEGCTSVPMRVFGTNLREVTIVANDGTAVPFPAGAAGPVRDIAPTTVYLYGTSGTQSYTVTATDGCGTTTVVTVRVRRYLEISVRVPRGPHDPLVVTEIPVEVELSCDPSALGVSRPIPVSLRLRAGTRAPEGLSLSPPRLEMADRGPASARIIVDTPSATCGTIEVTASIPPVSPSPPNHRDGVARFEIMDRDIDATFTGSATLMLVNPTGPLPDRVSPSYSLPSMTATLRFDAMRGGVVLTGFTLPPGGSVELIQTGGGTGTYDCATKAISIPVSFRIGLPVVEDTNINWTFTTGATASPSGMLSGSGMPPAASGATRLVAAGVGLDGYLRGVEALVTLTGTIDPVPPGCCV